MNSQVTITTFKQPSPEFWTTMGPFFASKTVRKEQPYLCHEDGYRWFIAVDETGPSPVVVGFASLHVDGKGAGHLHSLYVIPARRTGDLADRLLVAQLEHLKSCGVSVVNAVTQQKLLLEQHGFSVRGARGSYAVMDCSI